MRNQEDGRVGNGSRGKGECEGEGRLLGEGYLRYSTAIVIFGPWARLSGNTDVTLLLGFKRGHCLDSIGRHDEACSRERDRWHLEQRTISKVDTTVFEDSEEERGVSPVLEVLEEDSCIEAEVELIMYWEMRFASRRGHWLLGCNLPPSRRHQRSGSGTRRRISEQISTASQSSQQPAAGEDECKSDDGLYRVQVPLERSMPDSQQTVSTLDSKVVKALPSTNHATISKKTIPSIRVISSMRNPQRPHQNQNQNHGISSEDNTALRSGPARPRGEANVLIRDLHTQQIQRRDSLFASISPWHQPN
ncbi:conserved hypothetical protein [Histoplasma capsulatum H143]|uniref:Uncharacterized protein n=1 Tax=Ajellomyces capsulatus (strain H143) TaxID=544712 RepID=C6HAB8_AJECH|nr:conserved hypothetical protein [Histoplasma capsulatum H143]